MKLLLKNWNKYIINEVLTVFYYDEPMTATQKANYIFLKKQAKENEVFAVRLEAEILEDAGPEPMDTLIEALVRETPPLSNELVSSILGIGKKGIAFRLKNGNVLKIYSGGWFGGGQPGSEEEKFYASEKSKMFSADGSVSTLPIYDQGVANVLDAEVKFVEMAQVLPFDKYMDFTGRGSEEDLMEIETAITTIKRVVLMAEVPDYYGPPANQVTLPQRVERAIRSIRRSKLTGPEVRGLTIMLKYVITKYGPKYLEDFHEGNFGVVQQTMATNRPAFVLFDP
jgi:hypothetical protein